MHGRILIVEDDKEIRELLSLYLEHEHYQVMSVGNGAEALREAERFQPNLVILDILLPDMNGLEICKKLRNNSNLPVIFVSCQQASEHVIAGLDVGGDDYITKPFDPAILIARVRAQLRRSDMNKIIPNEQTSRRKFGHLEVDMDGMQAYVSGSPVALYAKELQLLIFFIDHPNRVSSARELHEQIWGWNCISDERTVMVHISNLRKKIELNPSRPELLQTVRGFGYKFVPMEAY